MTGADHVPPERKLPSPRRDQILRSVLDGEESNMMGRRRIRWIAPIAAAAAAALIAVGAVALTGGDERPGGQQSPVATPADNTVPLDLGPLTEAEVKEELGARMGSSFDEFTYPYARRIDGPERPAPVIVAVPLDPGSGFDALIDMGNLVDGVDDAQEPMPAHPLRRVDPKLEPRPDLGAAIYRYSQEYWTVAGIYGVTDTVDRVEVRVGSPDGPEPWRVAEPHEGYVFWATWFEKAAYEPGTELTLEWRAYDTDGNQIDPALLPDQTQTVTVPEPPPDPTGAEQYAETRNLLHGVASEYLDRIGEHLVAPGPRERSGVGGDREGWVAVSPEMGWVNEGDPGTGLVQISLGEDTPDTRLDMETFTGCPEDPDCEERDLGEDGSAWVLEREDGTFSVSYERPGGDLVWINTDLLHVNVTDTPVESIDITVEEALDFVTDDRLNLPLD